MTAEQTNTPATPKAALMLMKIIHFAQCMSLIIFTGLTFFLYTKGDLQEPNLEIHQTFQFMVPAILAIGIVAGYVFFPKLLRTLPANSDLLIKLRKYQSAMIIRDALLEGPGILAIVSFFLTQQLEYLGLMALALIILLYLTPTKSSIIKSLQLNVMEAQQLDM